MITITIYYTKTKSTPFGVLFVLAGVVRFELTTRGFGGGKFRGEKSFVYWVSWVFGGSRHKLCHNTVDKIGTDRKTGNDFRHSPF